MADQLPSQPIDTARRRLENQLYREIYPQFVDYYSSKVRKYALAKELALEALGKVMTKLSGYNQNLPLQNWAMRVARNHLFDYYRQRASHKHQLVQVLGDVVRDNQEAYSASAWFEERAGVTADQDYQLLESELIGQLQGWPGEEGDVVRRHLLDGEEPAGIAEQLAMKPKKVKRILSDAKQKIRTQLLVREVDPVPAYV